MAEPDAASRGVQPSLLESFTITGLYGYRTISLSSEYAATILIAKNGSGKTTLLASLDAVLKRQFSRLRDIEFDRITCKLRDRDEFIVFRHDIETYVASEAMDAEARRLEIASPTFFTLSEAFVADSSRAAFDDEIYEKVLQKFGYNRAAAAAALEKTINTALSQVPALQEAARTIKDAFAEIDVVYLPTYRRIELAISPSPDRYGRYRRFSIPGTKLSLYSGEMQFGLSDILDRLAQMNQQIVINSNEGYRELSANIINELLDGTFDDISTKTEEIPDRDELELFFSRLKDAPRRAYGPFVDVQSIPNIDKIYTGQDISDEKNKFLRYFLSKLNKVIQSTRDVESLVRDFINNCNRYLSLRDLSTDLARGLSPPDRSEPIDPDGKALTLNRKDLKVAVSSFATGKELHFDALSSGEKQMISLFAKLFLYPKQKLILIDEPELSLSLEWQRQILVDIINAPQCIQLVAITHSPFTFDNVLDPFARSLTSSLQEHDV